MQLNWVIANSEVQRKVRESCELVTATDDVTIELSGRYEFRVSEEGLRDMEELGVINVAWLYDPKREKTNNPHYHLHKDLVRVSYRKLTSLSVHGKILMGAKVVGFTTAVMITSSNEHTLCILKKRIFLEEQFKIIIHVNCLG